TRRRHTGWSGDWSSDVWSSDLPRFRGDSAARTWLYRIATNEALGILRRRREAPPVEDTDASSPDGTAAVVERLAVRAALARLTRSEERRVGSECRYRGATNAGG